MTQTHILPFEKPIREMHEKIRELREFSESQNIDVSTEITRMQDKIAETTRDIYENLTPWQRVQIARHPQRPYPLDYVRKMTAGFTELHGDRLYSDDRALVGGPAWLDGRRVMFICTCKGRDTRSNLECNFGMPYPEGYRKALRLMRMAGRFGMPIVSLIDTPGAYPGVQSEERHIAEAIAVNLRAAARLPVPVIVAVTGEGGSGGALGIGVGDRLLILEYAYFSVISPEGCAAILWQDRTHAPEAAEALRLTGNDLVELEIADRVLEEPNGGAHADPDAMSAALARALVEELDQLNGLPPEEMLEQRYRRLRAIGAFESSETR